MGSLSIWHWLIVLVVILLLFGKNKIPGLMGDMAKGITAFKKGLKEGDDAPAAPPADNGGPVVLNKAPAGEESVSRTAPPKS